MPTNQAEGFADNWAYLKTELNWLDRMLMLAVARQRQDTKNIDRIAQSRADKATSHWWKGVVYLEGNIAQDEHRQASPSTTTKASYQQQLESQIQASRRRGVSLALPDLCDRLELTSFEKNLVLMSLAPEVNRRYARLYRYLQDSEIGNKTDLPTLDLVLRLLCRNDAEWRSARQRLTSDSPLLAHKLLHWLSGDDTLLNRPLRLADPLVNYLLAEQPTAQTLDSLLLTAVTPRHMTWLQPTIATTDWSDLVLPPPQLAALHYWVQQIQGQKHTQTHWGLPSTAAPPGRVALLTGVAGTGKTMAAQAIAQALQAPLVQVDLAQVDPQDYAALLQAIAVQAPTVLLVKSAHNWFKPSTSLADFRLHQFLAQRRHLPAITLLAVEHQASVAVQWQRQVDYHLYLPLPNQDDRLRLWQRAFSPHLPLSTDIDWALLAQLPLSGGEIQAIATAAVCYAAAIDATKLEMQHLLQELAQQGKLPKRRSVEPRSGRQPSQPRASAKQRKRLAD
jgi:hypothetical protein